MTTAREIMTADPACARRGDVLADAARLMRDERVGVVPILGPEDELDGVVTDRDIVVRCVAAGGDPTAARVEEFCSDVITIGVDDDLEHAFRMMQTHSVRRLPVMEGARFVGIISQADIARTCPPERVGELVEAISSAPPSL